MAFRRIAAYIIDYGVILVWIGLITLVTLQGWITFPQPDVWTPSARWAAQGTAFALLTLPVWLYFTLWEAFGRKATLGKMVLSLRVDGSFAQVALRNGLKFLPWELSHTAIWHGMPVPLNSQPTAWGWAIFAVSIALVTAYLLTLFLPGNRTLYDRISGTRVERSV